LVNEPFPEAGRSDAERAQGHAPILQAGTHNIFLDLAFGVGLPGLVLFLWLMQRIIVHAFARFRHADDPMAQALMLGVGISVIGLVVRLFFDQMLVGTLALQFWVMVALAMAASTDTSARERAANVSR
jgi:O-antigen ligase